MPSDELTADMLEGLTDRPIVLADIGHHSYWVNHAAMAGKFAAIDVILRTVFQKPNILEKLFFGKYVRKLAKEYFK